MATATTAASRRRPPPLATGCRSSTSCGRASACSAACSSPAWCSPAIFLLTAIFAPLLAPYGFAQLRDADGPVRRAAAARRPSTCSGTTVGGYDVLSRVHLGRPDGAARHRRRRRCCRSSSASLLGLVVGLLRRLAGPRAGRHRRRDLRLPVAAARHRRGDRDQRRPVEPVGRHPRRGHLDHRRLHPAVLPGDPRRDRADQGRGVRRVGQGDRRRALADHVPARASATPPARCR